MTVYSSRTVAAVVPTRDNLDELTRCLASLQSQSHPPVRILVCVDGSTDGTLEHLATMTDSGPAVVETLTHPGNVHWGRAATRNLALASLREEYVWYVDSDMVLDPDALTRHLEMAHSSPCVSVGAVVYSNAAEAVWAGYLETRGRHRWPHGAVLPFTQFTTANALVRSEHVRRLSGFDERFEGYGGEDLDFAFRLQRLTGEPFVNNRRALATTVETKTIEQAMEQFEQYGAGNLHLLEELHPAIPRTFELQRLRSTRLADRAFVASINPNVEHLVDALIGVTPRGLRNHLLNYKVVAAIWRGYRASTVSR